MNVLKDTFSIRAAEIDQARAMLESMAKDLAASVYGRGMMKSNSQQATPQNQNVQLAQQQQAQQQAQLQQQAQQQQAQQQQQQAQGNPPAPLNAANLEKNTQALTKANQKAAGKGNQTPVAPTTAQPPFQFGASSPHGNPSYVGKPKDMNLQIPARKKQKVTGQTPQGATPSPQISKKSSPEMRRASESQAPPKPLFVCNEPDCDMSTAGFATEQALQAHIQEEHTKPKEDPMKFVQESLALSLGLEPDGTLKKEKLQEPAPAMSVTNSKQGQTPATLGATPMSADVKLPAGSMGKPQDGKGGIKSETTLKLVDAKPLETVPAVDPWSNSTIDPQSLMSNLGLENGGFRNVIGDLNVYRSLTPNDTPESSKDSGSSEPNSDISEGVSLEIDFGWHDVGGRDLLLDMNSTSLSGTLGSMDGVDIDTSLFIDPSSGPPPDWDDYHVDFNKPFELDTSFYSMET